MLSVKNEISIHTVFNYINTLRANKNFNTWCFIVIKKYVHWYLSVHRKHGELPSSASYGVLIWRRPTWVETCSFKSTKNVVVLTVLVYIFNIMDEQNFEQKAQIYILLLSSLVSAAKNDVT